MRIRALHSEYIDTKGLVALWCETLPAKNVLEGKKKAIKIILNLIRFKNATDPICAINIYLKMVWMEAKNRNYNFDESKFEKIDNRDLLGVTKGELR